MLWGGGKTRVGADSRHGRETMEPPHLQQHSLYSLHLYEPSNATMSHISNLFILNLSVCPPHRTIPTVRMQAPWKASQNGSLKLSHKSDMWFRCSGKYLNIYEKRREKMLSLPPPLLPSFRPMKWGSLLFLTRWRMAGIHILKIAASCCYCHYYVMGNRGAALIWLH